MQSWGYVELKDDQNSVQVYKDLFAIVSLHRLLFFRYLAIQTDKSLSYWSYIIQLDDHYDRIKLALFALKIKDFAPFIGFEYFFYFESIDLALFFMSYQL
jgi:hypothetical protein